MKYRRDLADLVAHAVVIFTKILRSKEERLVYGNLNIGTRNTSLMDVIGDLSNA